MNRFELYELYKRLYKKICKFCYILNDNCDKVDGIFRDREGFIYSFESPEYQLIFFKSKVYFNITYVEVHLFLLK